MMICHAQLIQIIRNERYYVYRQRQEKGEDKRISFQFINLCMYSRKYKVLGGKLVPNENVHVNVSIFFDEF
jgi:hypothetical protein